MMADTTRWTYAAGERDRNRVRVFSDPRKKGFIRIEWYEHGKRRSKSLKHHDRSLAKRQADDAAARFGELTGSTRDETPGPDTAGPISLGTLFDKYFESPRARRKTAAKQQHDRTAAEMFRRHFGENTPVLSLDEDDFQEFVEARHRGTIAPLRGNGRGVGDRMIEYDLRFLKSVFNWGTARRDSTGEAAFLPINPLQGFSIPSESSPNRPVLYHEEYSALLGVADQVDWRFKVALVLAHETGHRMSSIRKLRWSDVDMEAERIHWRARGEKSRFEHESGMTLKAREAFELARARCPAIGDAPVLPAPKDRSKPLSRWLLLKWWYRAEQLAGIEHVKGRAWHSLRRKFATELKHAPLSDLKDLGGWKDHNTILKCYQRGDDSTKRAVLASRRPLSRSHA